MFLKKEEKLTWLLGSCLRFGFLHVDVHGFYCRSLFILTHPRRAVFKHRAGVVTPRRKKTEHTLLFPPGVVTPISLECAVLHLTTRPRDTQDKTFTRPQVLLNVLTLSSLWVHRSGVLHEDNCPSSRLT